MNAASYPSPQARALSHVESSAHRRTDPTDPGTECRVLQGACFLT
ncbi:hypothetical protein ACIQZB_04485 [Streptomyces sp. NPDC097727]